MATLFHSNSRPPRWILACSIGAWVLIVLAIGSLWFHAASAQSGLHTTGGGAVYVVPITGTIDLRFAPYLLRVLNESEQQGAAAVTAGAA